MPGQPARAQNHHQTPLGLLQTPPSPGSRCLPPHRRTRGTGAPAPCCIRLSVRKEAGPEMSTALTKAGKGPLSFQSQRKAKECSNCHTAALISHASKVMLKILQARLQQYIDREFSDVQAGFTTCTDIQEEPEVKLLTSVGSQTNIYFCFTDYTKAFDCVDHNKLWKILKQTGIPDCLTCLMKNLYAGQETS